MTSLRPPDYDGFVCRWCGTPVDATRTDLPVVAGFNGKPKRFCSMLCREAWEVCDATKPSRSASEMLASDIAKMMMEQLEGVASAIADAGRIVITATSACAGAIIEIERTAKLFGMQMDKCAPAFALAPEPAPMPRDAPVLRRRRRKGQVL